MGGMTCSRTAAAIGIALAVASAASCQAQGFTVNGRVVAVLDGDTIEVLDAGKQLTRIRLASIDAPEKAQPFGQVAKQHLASLAYGRDVSARCRKREVRPESGRVRAVCTVYAADGSDLNLAQLIAGTAWFYAQYRREQSPAEAGRYERAERAARAARLGLWRETAPEEPWAWRHRQPATATVHGAR